MQENRQEEIYEMYGNDDEIDLTTPRANAIRVSPHGIHNELEVDGKKVQVVTPQAVIKIESMMRAMETKIKLLEQDLRNLRSRMTNTEMALHEARQELANKISYD